MNPLKVRYACLHDLNDYFKIQDLLAGLTDTEKARLRQNIGLNIEGQIDLGSVSEVTYQIFNETRLANALLPGKRYKIKDYCTIYKSNVLENGVYQSWGLEVNPSRVTPLIVTAVSKSIIDPRVIIAEAGKEDWEVYYNPTEVTLEDGIKTKGSIYYLKDNKNNSAPYDFKNIKQRVNSSPLYPIVDLYTFSDTSTGALIDASTLSNTRNNSIISCMPGNIFIGDTYNNIVYDSSSNIFYKGAHDNVIQWGTSNNIIKEPVRYINGAFSNKTIETGNLILSSTISKTVHKVNSDTIVSYLDPITYAYQIEKL